MDGGVSAEAAALWQLLLPCNQSSPHGVVVDAGQVNPPAGPAGQVANQQ
jgi:hypothetical protein